MDTGRLGECPVKVEINIGLLFKMRSLNIVHSDAITKELNLQLKFPENTMTLHNDFIGISCGDDEKIIVDDFMGGGSLQSAGSYDASKIGTPGELPLDESFCHESCAGKSDCNFSQYTRKNCVKEKPGVGDGDDLEDGTPNLDQCEITCAHSKTCNNNYVDRTARTYSKGVKKPPVKINQSSGVVSRRTRETWKMALGWIALLFILVAFYYVVRKYKHKFYKGNSLRRG